MTRCARIYRWGNYPGFRQPLWFRESGIWTRPLASGRGCPPIGSGTIAEWREKISISK
jgi:hypothetical protein